LQVPQEEADDALALLQEPIPESLDTDDDGVSYLQPRCPKCGSLDIEHEGLNKFVTFGSWLALGFPIRKSVNQWRCSICDHTWQSQPPADGESVTIAPEVMTRIFVATTNPGKVKDFAAIARQLNIDVVPFPKQDSMPEVVEDGDTFEANAIKKAEAYSAHLANELVIADDSGLEVTALNRAPGVHSARFAQADADPKPSDSDNNYKLLHELSRTPNADRAARFVCVIGAARDGKVLQTFRGEVWGEILSTPIGRKGFGYDPLFFVPPADKTFAEMNAEEKAQYSHRGKAFKLFLDWLQPEIGRR
jgi:XTP/dITP diphosphohydrolase